MAERIDVSDLNIYYGTYLAVQDVTVSIGPRSITALIGPSGCGKSTFLRSLNRMHEVIPGARFEGKVVLDGQDLYGADVDPAEVRRHLGMVFQRPNPFPAMSIYDNVAAGIRLDAEKVRKADLDDLGERSLRGANLWDAVKDRLQRPGAGLSGGQQQRCASPARSPSSRGCSSVHHPDRHARHAAAARVSEQTGFLDVSGVGRPGRLIQFTAAEKIFGNPDQKATRDYICGRFG